jgi:hypothetical protein
MLTQELINQFKQTEWEFVNEILYTMCRENFSHQQTDKIIGKVVLIGRTYAAAIERRKNKTELNDGFYIDKVAPQFKKSKLDFYLGSLKANTDLTENMIPDILNTHFYLTNLIKQLTEQHKRSFSSKYLHFHLPHLFFIYDSRAVTALRQFKSRVPRDLNYILQSEEVDKEYARFYLKCFDLKRQIKHQHNISLTNRQFDNLLMKIANQNGK